MHAYADPRSSARDRAFERLYRSYVKDVYRYTLALLRNPADAEDATQTTFLNAYRAYKRGEEPLKPQNWLIKIAHNACRTRYLRASRRPQEVPLEDGLRELAVPQEEIPNVKAVLEALSQLPFNQRAALVMRELEGRSYVEIAEALDVTVPAVEALIFRARRALRVRRSALRSLAALPVPTSLTSFSGGGAVAGGSALAGSGVLLKAALAVGVAALAGTAVDTAVFGAREPSALGETAAAATAASTRAADPTDGRLGVTQARGQAGRLVTVTGTQRRADGPASARLPRRAQPAKPSLGDGAPGLTVTPVAASSPSGSSSGSAPAAPSSPVAAVTEVVNEAVPTPAVPPVSVAVPAVPLPVSPPPPPAVAVPPPPELPPPPPLPPPPTLP